MTLRWEKFLKVTEWTSGYQSINNLLKFLKHRKNGSESSRRNYCSSVYYLCKYADKLPDELVCLKKADVEKLVDDFCYHKKESGWCPSTVNMNMRLLKTFFRVNGFKGNNQIEVEAYHQPARLRYREEYIPTLEEARRMANVAGSLRDRAITLFMVSTGLRNSTLRAILCGDMKKELETGKMNILVKVHMGMKKTVDSACKGNIEYSVFTSSEATEALKLYLGDRRRRLGEISEAEVLFCSEHNLIPLNERACKPLTRREIEVMVKKAARSAGIKDWKKVTPHCLRKTFESILRSRLEDGTRLDVKTQEYFMGHILPGNQDTYYDKTKIEELRKEYAKLVFKPTEQVNYGAFESLRVVAEAMGIDSAKLLYSKKRDLGRDLDIEEKVSLLKDAVKKLSPQSKDANTTEPKPATNSESNNQNHDMKYPSPTHKPALSDIANGKMVKTPEEITANKPIPHDLGNHKCSKTENAQIGNMVISKCDVHPATFYEENSVSSRPQFTLKQLNAHVPEALYVAAKRGAINLGLKLHVWVSTALNAFLFLQEHLERQETLQLDRNYPIFFLMAARNHLYRQGYAVADLNAEISKAAEFLESGRDYHNCQH